MPRLLIIAASLLLLSGCSTDVVTDFWVRKRTLDNYGAKVAMEAEEMGLPYAYLMALIALECSGRKPCPPRYEEGINAKLVALRSGERKRFEGIPSKTVHDATDEAIRNLAMSWGPFQVMGYKCIQMNMNVADIRGEKSLQHGMQWIVQNYGGDLSAGRFRDAFHRHNAGKPYPKSGEPDTHDKNYVPKGLAHMKWFEAHRPD